MTTTAERNDEQPPAAGGNATQAPGSAALAPELAARLLRRVTLAPGEHASQPSYAPFTGELVGRVPVCTEVDVDAAVRLARAAQQKWARTSAAHRRRIFLRYHDLVLDRQDGILDLVQLETGKARKSAFEELADVAMVSRYYAHTAARQLRPRRRWGAMPGLTAATEYYHPKGVVGIIAPWNYPLTLPITDAIPALLAGNGVVLKPDSQTPFTALLGVNLLREAGLPEDLFQVITGAGRSIGTPMIDRVDYLMFTGSTATGRHIAAQCGQRLIGFSAELGGEADQSLAALSGDVSAGGGAPGEHQVIHAVDHRRTDGPTRTGDHLEQVLRQAGLPQQVHSQQGGERRLRIRLEHHPVAGQQGGDGVGDGQRQRVVPGRDDAHHALRVVVLGGGGQPRQRAPAAAGSQLPGSGVSVVTGDDRHVGELLERRLAGLAGLQLDQIEDLVLPVQDQVVVAQEDPPPVRRRCPSPLLLRRPGQAHGGVHVDLGADRHSADQLAGEWRVRRLAGVLPRRQRHPAQQPGGQLRRQRGTPWGLRGVTSGRWRLLVIALGRGGHRRSSWLGAHGARVRAGTWGDVTRRLPTRVTYPADRLRRLMLWRTRRAAMPTAGGPARRGAAI